MNLSTGSRYFAHKIPEKTEIAKLHIFTANGQNFYTAYQATENDSLFSNVEISSYEDIKRPELNKNGSFYIFTHQNNSY